MKIAVIHGDAQKLLEEMGPLLGSMARMGHEVNGLAPAEDPGIASQFEALGVDFALIPLNRYGINPIADIASLLHLKQALFRIRPDMVLSTTFKAMIYGSLAARLAWVGEKKNVFALVDGAGFALGGKPGLLRRIRYMVAKSLCQSGFRSCDGVLFRRAADEVFYRRLGVIPGRVVTGNLEDQEIAGDREALDSAILSFIGLR